MALAGYDLTFHTPGEGRYLYIEMFTKRARKHNLNFQKVGSID